MLKKKRIALAVSGLLCLSSEIYAAQLSDGLQEVVVTAQRREDSLQDIPVAVSVLNSKQLESLGVTSVSGLSNGIVPSLRIMTVGNPSSTLVMAIRGNGPVDVQPYTRAQTVAVYLDEIYLGRPQGLSLDLADLDRIEVLRGPQATLFGRNTTSGAVRLISKKPTGEFGFDQTIGFGNYNLFQSITRVNLPEYAGFKVKLDYVHTKRDGWVKNTAPGESDYNAINHNGGKITIDFDPLDRLSFSLAVDNSRVADTNSYYQDYRDFLGMIGNEPHRDTKVRAPVPNKPSYVYQTGGAFTVGWDIADSFTFKSYTGYRRLKENSYTSFGSSIYYNGCINTTADRERQFTQEFQLLGNTDSLHYVAGLYYFDGHGTQDIVLRFAQDAMFNPIDPPVADPLAPDRYVTASSTSKAAYSQLTWTPDILDRKLHLTAGVRYTKDESDGSRTEFTYTPFDLDYSHWDTTFIADYSWLEELSTYLKRSTGFRAGGVNPRSQIFVPFGPEKVATWEAGIKSQFWENRVRLNADVFHTQYNDLQYDFSQSTANINNTETFNAADTVTVKGLEMDLTVVPAEGLTLGLSYTYLHDNLDTQPNPITGKPQGFEMPQTPRHAGAATVDYSFRPFSVGLITAHLDAQSSSGYAHQSTDIQQQSGYTIFNARLTLGDLDVAQGKASVALWIKNLNNAAYPEFAFPLFDPPIALIRTWNQPRTFGVDANYKF